MAQPLSDGQTESPAPAVPTSRFVGKEIVLDLPSGKLRTLDAAVMPPLELLPRRVEVKDGVFQEKATLARETFEVFPSATWQIFSQTHVDANWGRSSFRRSEGSFSAWCAQSGTAAPGAGQDVPNNMATWMVTGPINLSNVSSGDLAFDLWLDTEAGFDDFGVAASLNGTNFFAFLRDQSTAGWERFSVGLDNWGGLGDLTGKNQVWFAFIYLTDGSITGEGAYVDDAVLSGDIGGGVNLVVNQIDAGSCPLMQAFVVVNDGQGNPIGGLTQQNFTLGENGVNQTVDSQPATGSGEDLATTLVLDGSGSLSSSDVQNMKSASNQFIDLLAVDDLVAVYHFGSNVVRVQDYTANKNAAKAAVNALTNGLGLTSLYDAIVDAANYSTTLGGRRALVVMTDGRNNNSAASLDDAIQAAIAAGVPVFTIGFGNVDQQVLERIANETGGLFFLGADSGDLLVILQRIGQQLASQYLLEWTADTIDGGSHSVTIGVNVQGQTDSKTLTYSQAGTPCANATVCVENETTLCLGGQRFRVRVNWTDFQGNQGPGRVVQSCGSDSSGLFWFFGPDNWEMLVKTVDACPLNQHHWIFFSATTNVMYRVTVTDTFTGAQKVYTNPLGNAASAVTDTSAFDCP